MTNSTRGVGEVTVSAGGDLVPIAVRDAALRLVHEGLAGESFPLQAGLYLVQALLPDGMGPEERLTVEPSSRVTIDLGQQISEADTPFSAGASVEAPDVLVSLVTRALEALGQLVTRSEPKKTTGPARGSRRGGARRPQKAVPSWAFRVGSVSQDQTRRFQWEEALDPRVEESADSILIRLSVPSGAVPVAQILRRGQIPLNVMMPPSSEHQGQAILVASRGKGRYMFAAFPPESRVGLAARFLATGEADEGARLIGRDDAVSLLESKMADPVGAAVGAYLLLRIGDLDAMQDWTKNLADRFPWLPDGSIVEGERLMQSGDRQLAIGRFIEGAARGLPLFTEGYSLVLSRLRQFATGEHGDAASTARAAAKKGLTRLGQWTPFVDLGAPTLTFTGGDPMDPSHTQAPLGRGVSAVRFVRTADGLRARG